MQLRIQSQAMAQPVADQQISEDLTLAVPAAAAPDQQKSAELKATRAVADRPTSGGLKSNEAKTAGNRTIKNGMTALPPGFEPGPYSIYCGRGKGYYNSVGNRRLRVTVGNHLPQYLAAAGAPMERSRIIARVAALVKSICPVGAFIYPCDGIYYELSDRGARHKVSAMFRDLINAGKGKKATKAIKQAAKDAKAAGSDTESEDENEGVARRRRRPSIDSSSSSSSASMGSYYDVDGKPASIDEAEDGNSVCIEDINRVLKKRDL